MPIRVYKFGCRTPSNEPLAIRLLGQAWWHAEMLRRASNMCVRDVKTLMSLDDDVSHVIAKHFDTHREKGRMIRGERGHLIDAGTYWLVEAAALAASKKVGLDMRRRSDFDGTGRIGAFISSNKQFSASIPWSHPRVSLSEPDVRGHAVLTILVGAAKSPETITWPIKLHRAFPDGATIKQVAVQRVRDGHRFRWQALVTLSYETAVECDRAATGVVGIDIGWRSEDEGMMRVATHDGSDGDVGSLQIDTHTTYLYADSVRSIRDENFDDAKTYVQRVELPGTTHAHLWKNKERMHKVAARTCDLGAIWWRERDKHLEDIECGVRSRAIRRRLNAFRMYVDALAKRYRFVVLEDMPMNVWVNRGKTAGLERRRSAAALALLQVCILHRFGNDRVDWAPPEYTTMTCDACGTVRDGPVGARAFWVCDECGEEHHQDENAARILRLDGERWRDGGNTPRARIRKATKPGKKKKGLARVPVSTGLINDTARKPTAEAAE